MTMLDKWPTTPLKNAITLDQPNPPTRLALPLSHVLHAQRCEYRRRGIQMSEFSFTKKVTRMSEYSDHSLEALPLEPA